MQSKLTPRPFWLMYFLRNTHIIMYIMIGSSRQPRIENGMPDDRVTVTATGVVVFYTCFPNHVLVGASMVECRDGAWNEPPDCIRGKFVCLY